MMNILNTSALRWAYPGADTHDSGKMIMDESCNNLTACYINFQNLLQQAFLFLCVYIKPVFSISNSLKNYYKLY